MLCMLYKSGPVVIIGDFNAHIDLPESNHAQGHSNAQGHLIMDMIDHTGHYTASFCDLATGPTHRFYGGSDQNTTVDFCFVDCWAAHRVLECGVIP